jgi:probable HAF family extracellular repeat protein
MKTRWLRHFLLGLVGALVIALGVSIFTATTAATRFYYSITDLGTLGGSESYAMSINDMGQIVGASQTSNGDSQAFLWQGGAMTDIGTAAGYNNSIAIDINNAGQVLGGTTSQAPVLVSSPFLWSNNTITTLPDPEICFASGINDAEQIVGLCIIVGTNYASAVFLPGGSIILDLPSSAYDINNSGQVVGAFNPEIVDVNTNNDYEAFLWQDGTATELGTLGGTNSVAYAVNDVGQVVGKAQNTTGDFHAFFWDGAMQDLGTLANYTSSVAYGINNKGRVVGTATNSSGSSHAFVRLNNGMRDLNNLIPANSGWELIEARDINNNGRIVGYGTVNGENHAFVLTPTWVTR